MGQPRPACRITDAPEHGRPLLIAREASTHEWSAAEERYVWPPTTFACFYPFCWARFTSSMLTHCPALASE
jgi:hypothetical protein